MTLPSRDHGYLGAATPDQLGALIFELASQIHVERQRRMALEKMLLRSGVLMPGALDALAEDEEVTEEGRAALDVALRRLLRIITETGDARGPLRTEAVGVE